MTDPRVEPEPELVRVAEVTTLVVRGVLPTDELPAFFDRSSPAGSRRGWRARG
jgi:hypothetical protein